MAVITVTTEPVVEPETHTVTFYEQVVDELMGAVDKVSLIIPKLGEAEATATARQARKNLYVPVACIAAAIDAVEQLPAVAAANKLDPVRSRVLLQFMDAVTPMYNQLSAVSRRLRHALRAAKSELGTGALHVYRICQSLASDERSPLVDAHVLTMKQALARKTTPKAEREARKARKLQDEVNKELLRLGVDRAFLERALAEKEVKKAA